MRFGTASSLAGLALFAGTALAGDSENTKQRLQPTKRALPSDTVAGQQAQSQSLRDASAEYAKHQAAGSGSEQSRVGGEDCASAVVIPSLPYNDTGNTSAFVDNYNEVCPFTNTGGKDVVYSYTPAASGFIDIDLCPSAYDTKVYVYENSCPGAGDIACNDDACGTSGFRSQLLGVPVAAGSTYYIVVDAYSAVDSGNYTLAVTAAAPPPDCPAGSLFSQPTDTPSAAWVAGTTELAIGLKRYENYSGVVGVINGLSFWGVTGVNAGAGFVQCTENPIPVEVVFYADAAGTPGAATCSYSVNAVGTPTGLSFAGFPLQEFSIALPGGCVQPSGWVSIQGQGDPNCWLLWMSSGGDGGGTSLLEDPNGIGPDTFNLSLCLSGSSGGVVGACCDDSTGICQDNVDITECLGPGQRFAANTLCADLTPPCGEITGACCFPDGSCSILTQQDCSTDGGNWLGANSTCAQCPCIVPCPAGGIPEGEPDCGPNYNDLYNGGCNSAPPVFQPISCGDTICGESGTYPFTDPNGTFDFRDTDWYSITTAGETEIVVSAEAEFAAGVFIVSMSGGPCSGLVTEASASGGECAALTASACLPAGTYYVILVPSSFTGVPCGARYTLSVDCNPCVLPRGACCFADGSCQGNTTEAECLAAGGLTWTDGAGCDPNPCPQPLPNDNCPDCEPIGAVPFNTTIDNNNALPGAPASSCSGGTGVTQNDVWYCYTPAEDCLLSLTVDPTNYDGSTAVWTGPDCNNLTEIACADEPEPHVINFAATAGTTYFIQIGDWGSFEGGGPTNISLDCQGAGTGACCFPDGSCQELSAVDCFGAGGDFGGVGSGCTPNDCPQPTAGDNCAAPQDISLPEELPYSNANSTCGRVDDYDATCMGSYDGGEDMIYRITLSEPKCLQFTLTANSIWAGMAIDDTCPLGGTGACIATATTSLNPDVMVANLAAGTYYLMIDTFPAPDCADFTLDIVECPPLPTNESCPTAEEIDSVPFATSVDNNFSTADGGPGTCNTGSATVMQNDLWYYYTADSNCLLTYTVNPTNYDGITQVYTGPDCNNLAQLACLDEPEPSTISFQATAGTTYWFQVGDWGTSEGGGPTNISLTCDLCGDLDGDRDVDTGDFSLFVAAYGSCSGDGNYNAAADYDNDGCVELEDYQAWVQCFRDANPGPGHNPPRLPRTFGGKKLPTNIDP